MGENEEWTDLYPKFAEIAKKEGFPAVAACFNMIATVEKAHEARYTKLLQLLESGMVFEANEALIWMCRNCGYLHTGPKAPNTCPACLHPQAYFERKALNY